MPTSSSRQLDAILTLINLARPKRVLDVGIGDGRYGYLVRQTLDPLHLQQQWSTCIEGIEAFEPYVTPVHRYVYDNITVGDALAVLPALASDSFDLALFIDVIEHMSVDDGHRALADLRRIATSVIVATPRQWFAQGDIHGNCFERHRSRWSAREFVGAQIVPNDAQTIALFTRDEHIRTRIKGWYARQRIKALVPPLAHPILFQLHGARRRRNEP